MKEAFEFYLQNQEEFVERYQGKYLAIKGREVLGVYETEDEAITVTSQSHDLGTFLVQLVEPGTKSYTQTYHSRVVFA